MGAEISKNLMLCGIRSLTLTDERRVTEDDLDSNFLLENDSVGKNVSSLLTFALVDFKEFALFPACKSLLTESEVAESHGKTRG